MRASRRPGLLVLDVLAVLVFAVVGRASHAADVLDPLGVLGTAAPFLVGALVGALVARSWRAPASWRSGVFTWVGAAGIGLGLWFAAHGRLIGTFALVATVSLAVVLLGWRGVAHLTTASHRRRARSRTRSRV